MAFEDRQSKRHLELLTFLEGSNRVFAAMVRDTTRSLLLYRIAGSTNKKEEMSFLRDTITRIRERREVISDTPETYVDFQSIFGEDIETKSVGDLFSIMTDVLEELSPSEVYQLLIEVRKETIHSDSLVTDIPQSSLETSTDAY